MAQHHDTTAVAQDIALHCDDQDGRPMAFIATASYSPDDPYAVWLTFHVPAGEVPWVMSRQLLTQGLTMPAGAGDVLVWPTIDEDGLDVVGMDFRTPEGRLLVQVRAHELIAFLARTWDVVPEGTESIDVDALIADLLG